MQNLRPASLAWPALLSVLLALSATAASIDEQVAALIQQGDQSLEQAKQAYAAKSYNPGNTARTNAIKSYAKAIELDPKSYLAWQKLGDIQFGEAGTPSNFDGAIKAYAEVVKLQPEWFYGYYQLARCYQRQDRFKEAIPAAERAIQLNPNDPAGYYNLGFILADMGRNDEARKLQARLQPVNPALAQQLATKIGEAAQPTSNTERPTTFANPKIELVAIKPGSFQLGADDKSAGRPATIKKAFSIGKYPVTQAQWQMVMGENPSHHKSCGGDCPVEGVSWNDAQLFISRLNSLKDGHRYRLPSEAEWEYAYRAGRSAKEYENREGYWHSENSGSKTHPVGQKPANAFGVHDIAGHVEEWCMDYFVKDAGALPTDGGPLLSTEVRKYRSLRGRSWYANVLGNPATRRQGLQPQKTNWNVGLRVAAD